MFEQPEHVLRASPRSCEVNRDVLGSFLTCWKCFMHSVGMHHLGPMEILELTRQRMTFVAVLVTAFLTSTGTPARAQSDADFFNGRQMTIAVGGASGTIYDNYARLLARHLPKHLPGSPRIIVQNMPG